MPGEIDQLLDTLRDMPTGEVPADWCREVVSLLGVADASFAVIGAAGQRYTVSASSDRAGTLDQWQFTLDQGPCLQAAHTGEVTSAATSDPTVPWPELAGKARGLGFGFIAGIPLAVAGVTFGALNLQAEAGSLSDDTIARAVALAERVSPVLLEHVVGNLSEPGTRDDRATIHQATGIVAGQLGVTPDDALAALRARAWSDDRLLDDLAEDITSGAVRLDQP